MTCCRVKISRKGAKDAKDVVSTNLSNTQHQARYVISVDLGRVFLSPTAMYTGKRPDGPGAPRPERFKMFVDSTKGRKKSYLGALCVLA